MRNRIVWVMALASIITCIFISTGAPRADAGANCTEPLCGKFQVLNNVWMDEAVRIAHNWCSYGVCNDGERAWVQPGQSTQAYWKDTDGVYVPDVRDFVCAYYQQWVGWVIWKRFAATGWHQIRNDFDGIWCGYQYA